MTRPAAKTFAVMEVLGAFVTDAGTRAAIDVQTSDGVIRLSLDFRDLMTLPLVSWRAAQALMPPGYAHPYSVEKVHVMNNPSDGIAGLLVGIAQGPTLILSFGPEHLPHLAEEVAIAIRDLPSATPAGKGPH